ncbi:hypothetical protein FCM35_KLT13423 [Carex littledalei]|uniref:Uncharacterized protein n=1 Tax=Carex littledalei TaxID=544730 RepID=A0A833QIS5_9POAL|nr:hypothetical protein FCM35_KLT13423 [Carex littledalei]
MRTDRLASLRRSQLSPSSRPRSPRIHFPATCFSTRSPRLLLFCFGGYFSRRDYRLYLFPSNPCSLLRFAQLPLSLFSTAATPSTVVDPARTPLLSSVSLAVPLLWSPLSLFGSEPSLLTVIGASHLCWLRFFPVV